MKKTFGESLIAKGENPGGQTSQSPNETIRNQQALPRQQLKFNQEADGPRWNSGFDKKAK